MAKRLSPTLTSVALAFLATWPALAFDNSVPLGGPSVERAQGIAPPAIPAARDLSRLSAAAPSPSPVASEPVDPSSENRKPVHVMLTPEQKKKQAYIAELKKKIAEKRAQLTALEKAQEAQLKKQIEDLKKVPK